MAEKVARNFIKRYGLQAFRSFITGLEGHRSGQELAQELGVSRQRVQQWKDAFGVSIAVYMPRAEVARLLGRDK
jgi:DNA-directed RNA polymerase specialized sigma subunit